MQTMHIHGRRHSILRSMLLALAVGPAASFAAAAYELVDLGIDVIPADINNNGTIVGSRSNGSAKVAIRIRRGGGVEDLVGGVAATGINDLELIVGSTSTGAFVFDGRVIDLGSDHSATDINEFNLVCGSEDGQNPYRPTPLPVNPALYDHAANGQRWQVIDVARVYSRGTRKGVYADLYLLLGINDAGYAVGRKSRYGLAGSSAILTTPTFDMVTFLPIPSGGAAIAINNANRVVGTTGETYAHAYMYDVDTGAYTDLGTLHGGLRSSAADINDLDQVVGSSWLSTVNTSVYDPTLYHAFIWDVASGMTDLNDVSGAPDWLLTAATAINEQGEIVGTAIVNGQVHGFLLTNDVPPPPPQENQAPVAALSAEVTSGRAPLSVGFSAAQSSDPDGDLLSFEWDFGDGTTATSSGPAATHVYDSAGRYTAVVTVSDGSLSDSAAIEISVLRARRRR